DESAVRVEHALSGGANLGKALELSDAERGLGIRQAVVVPDLGMPIASRRVHRVITKESKASRKCRVIRQHHPALARRDDLVAVKREAGCIRQRSDNAPSIHRAVTLGGVLDDEDILPAS